MPSTTTQEALDRARTSASLANYGAIFAGFAEKGITDIQPRVNVFTYAAWQALGRQVKKGEHGVRCVTWVPMTKKDEAGEAQPIGRKPKSTTVFHVSQTEPRAGYSEGLWQYALQQGALDGQEEETPAPTVSTTITSSTDTHAPQFDFADDQFTEIKRA